MNVWLGVGNRSESDSIIDGSDRRFFAPVCGEDDEAAVGRGAGVVARDVVLLVSVGRSVAVPEAPFAFGTSAAEEDAGTEAVESSAASS